MKLKKVISILTAAALTVTGLSGCNSSDNTSTNTSASVNTEDDFVLKIGYGGGLCEAPLHIAAQNGYFEEEGLKFEMVRVDAAETVSAVGSGKLDAGFGMIAKFLPPIENGLPIRLTAGIDKGCTKVLVKADSGINSVEDLKGKKLGVPGLAAAPSIILKRSLTKAGIDISPESGQVEWAVFNMGDLPAALNNNAIDAAGMADPASSLAKKEYGFKYLIDTATDPDYKDEYCCSIFVTEDVIKNHPEAAEKYTRAVMKASLWVKDNVEEATKIQVENNWVAGDSEFNADILADYDFNPSVQGGYDALKAVVPELQKIDLLKQDTDVDSFVDKSYYFIDGLTDEEVYAEYEKSKADK